MTELRFELVPKQESRKPFRHKKPHSISGKVKKATEKDFSYMINKSSYLLNLSN